MKKNVSDTVKPRLFPHDILFGAVGVLLLLVMLSVWLLCGMYARYVVSDSYSDAAHVAGSISMVEVWEHEAVLENGEYQLTAKEVTENTYHKVIPGVDIAKDPFIRLSGAPDVPCELYVRVTENNIPKDSDGQPMVTYQLNGEWTETDEAGVYKYTKTIDSNTTETVFPILEQSGDVINDHKCELKVSEHYVGNGEFTLTFSAWLVQKDGSSTRNLS